MPVYGDFSQAVTIEGFPALVHDLSIDESSDGRVASIDFVLEELQVPGQGNAFDSAWIGNDVTVTQTVGGQSQTWVARIIDVTEKRAGAYTFKRVQCRTLESAASVTRFLASWGNISATALILDAWQTYGIQSTELQGLSLAGVENNPEIIEEYTSKFDSLYDLMEQVCLLTNWAWKIRDGVVYFFDPLTNAGPAITQGDLKIERDTLTLKQSLEGVYNVYRMQAWQYKTLTVSKSVEDGDCVDGVLFDPSLFDRYELVDASIKEQGWLDKGLKVDQVEIEDGIARFNGSIVANVPDFPPPSFPTYGGDPTTVTVDFVVRTLVWVERIDEQSILLYGRRDAAPISDDGGLNVAAATRLLDEMLRYRAYPSYDLSMDVVGVGWEPDQVVNVQLDDPPFSAPLYVTGVKRTTDGSDLSVSISLTSPSEIVEGGEAPPSQARRSRSKIDPAYEIGRRVERLERRIAHPASQLGKNTDLFGVFGGSYSTQDAYGWSAGIITRDLSVGGGDDVTGWTEAWSFALQPPVDTAGWRGTVTPVRKPDPIAASSGWQGAVAGDIAATPRPEAQTGWTGTVRVEVPPAITADDDVVLGGGEGLLAGDDVVLGNVGGLYTDEADVSL